MYIVAHFVCSLLSFKVATHGNNNSGIQLIYSNSQVICLLSQSNF